ncbi:MAG: hypothetical protein ACOY3F_08030 [Bacillota bacterium]
MPWTRRVVRWAGDGRAVLPGAVAVLGVTVAVCVWRGIPWWAGPAGFLAGLAAVPLAEGVNAVLDRLAAGRRGGRDN